MPDYKELIASKTPKLSSPPIYEMRGDLFVPNEDLARGPWYPGVQHGGAIVALLARGVEQLPVLSSIDMRITSLNVEMFRKVPLAPVQIKAKIVRNGKRIGALEASMFDEAGEVELARAQALRIRSASGIVQPAQVPPRFEQDLQPKNHTVSLEKLEFEEEMFSYTGAFDSWHDPKDPISCSWWRLNHPLVDDEPLSQLVRVGATADLIMSANMFLRDSENSESDHNYISVNPNLFISLQKEMEGDWIGLEATVRIDDMGTGETDAVLYDQNGRFGRGVKSLLIDKI